MEQITMSLAWLKRPAGLAAGLLLAASAATGAEKLQVFILSGQSNMVGHASSYLLANLMDSPRAEDAGLAKLMIGDYERTLKAVKPEMDALQKEVDALTGPAGEPRKAAQHMANFIRDIRAEFKAPGMPFVIGVIGIGSWAKKTDYSTLSHAAAVELGKKETADQPVAVAQREAAALPEFAGTMVAVETYPYYDYAVLPLYEVWKDRPSEWQNAGSGRPYHHLGSAPFFARFGYARGRRSLS
jgi:hypothetical protein